MNTPKPCDTTASRATHITRRGEYAVALNCTMTNARENTMPVRAIIPEAIAEPIAIPDATLMVETSSGRKRCSSRGNAIPKTNVTAV